MSGHPNRGGFRKALEHAFTFARVERYFQVDGIPYVTVNDGQSFFGCSAIPVLTQGGAQDAFEHVPLTPFPPMGLPSSPAIPAGSEVMVLHGANGRLYAIGASFHEQTGLVDGVLKPAQTSDRSRSVGTADRATANGGARVIIDEHGEVTVDLTDVAATNFRVQLPADGVLRVSRNGSATERVPLAGPLVSLLNELRAYMLDVEARAITGVGNAGGVMATSTLYPDGPPTADGTLKAAAIHVSSDAEAP